MAPNPIGRDRRLDTPLGTIELDLPLPLAPNRVPANPMAKHRAKRSYQRMAWATACETARPFRDPPALVHVTADFRVMQYRDPDNLTASLKWVLDALRQKQQGEPWRGHHQHCGFMVDDDPTHLSLGPVKQTLVHKRREQGVRVAVTWGGRLEGLLELGADLELRGVCR